MLIYKLSCVFSNHQYFGKFCESFLTLEIWTIKMLDKIPLTPFAVVVLGALAKAS